MLNAEKFKDGITAIMNKSDYFAIDIDNPNAVRHCGGLECKNCVLNNNDYNDCNFVRIKWLLSEYKEPVKLTRLEYEILKYILNHTEYKYIARSKLGEIFIYENEPIKNGDDWSVLLNGGGFTTIVFLSELFKFINWLDLKPTSIKDVLDNCEVIDGESE